MRGKGCKLDEIELRVKKAEKLLQDGKKEFEVGLYERCCSTSYYSMFHAAKAMILCLGRDSKTHRGTIYLIWENKEELKLSESDCSKLSRAFDLREESDYGIFREISKDLAEEILRDAEYFIRKARNVIESRKRLKS